MEIRSEDFSDYVSMLTGDTGECAARSNVIMNRIVEKTGGEIDKNTAIRLQREAFDLLAEKYGVSVTQEDVEREMEDTIKRLAVIKDVIECAEGKAAKCV